MDPQIIDDIATSVSKWRMYPHFDVAHYILMSTAVREDIPQSGRPIFWFVSNFIFRKLNLKICIYYELDLYARTVVYCKNLMIVGTRITEHICASPVD